MVGKHRSARIASIGRSEFAIQLMTVVEVIAEYQRRWLLADKLTTDDECLRQSIGRRLYGITQVESPLATVTE